MIWDLPIRDGRSQSRFLRKAYAGHSRSKERIPIEMLEDIFEHEEKIVSVVYNYVDEGTEAAAM